MQMYVCVLFFLEYLGALFQTKIDIEHLHDNQLLTTIDSSSIDTHQNSVINRTSRLFFVLLGITLVGIVFALTIFFIQKMYVLTIHTKENDLFVYFVDINFNIQSYLKVHKQLMNNLTMHRQHHL